MKGNLFRVPILVAALAVACLGFGAGTTRADTITLNVSGTLSPFDGASCGSAGCTFGGTLVINNSPGAANSGLVSVDITMSGESPTVGPFTSLPLVQTAGSTATSVNAYDTSFNNVALIFATPTAGSLVGYTGGALSTSTLVLTSEGCCGYWELISGSLTEAALVSVAEPPTLVLLTVGLAGVGALLLLDKRRGLAGYKVRGL